LDQIEKQQATIEEQKSKIKIVSTELKTIKEVEMVKLKSDLEAKTSEAKSLSD